MNSGLKNHSGTTKIEGLRMSSSSALSMTCLQVSKANVENHSVAFPFCVLRRKAATFEQLEKIRVPDWNFISTAIPLCGNSLKFTQKDMKDAPLSQKDFRSYKHLAHPACGLMLFFKKHMLCCLGPRLAGSTPKNFSALSMDIPTNLERNSQLKKYGPATIPKWQCPCGAENWKIRNTRPVKKKTIFSFKMDPSMEDRWRFVWSFCDFLWKFWTPASGPSLVTEFEDLGWLQDCPVCITLFHHLTKKLQTQKIVELSKVPTYKIIIVP